MKVEQRHELEFRNDRPPTIGELFSMLKIAEQQGFAETTPVQIRAGTDGRDYYFHATIQRNPGCIGGTRMSVGRKKQL